MEILGPKYEVRFPTSGGGSQFVRYFKTKFEAIKWLQKYFSADFDGKIDVIKEVKK